VKDIARISGIPAAIILAAICLYAAVYLFFTALQPLGGFEGTLLDVDDSMFLEYVRVKVLTAEGDTIARHVYDTHQYSLFRGDIIVRQRGFCKSITVKKRAFPTEYGVEDTEDGGENR
jgi:hypothetical protein